MYEKVSLTWFLAAFRQPCIFAIIFLMVIQDFPPHSIKCVIFNYQKRLLKSRMLIKTLLERIECYNVVDVSQQKQQLSFFSNIEP
jgi:hypothetical protein